MKQSKAIQAYDAVWENTSAIIAGAANSPHKIKIEEFLGTIFTSGHYYYYIIDFGHYPSFSIPYIHESTLNYFGVGKEDFSVPYILESFHQEDIEFGAACEKAIMKFCSALEPPEDKAKYKFTYCFRTKDHTGSYNLVQHQAIALSLTSEGGLGYVLNIHTRIDHLTKVNPGTLSIIGIDERDSYFNIDPYAPVFAPKRLPNYSKREKDVIRLCSEGLSSRDISQALDIKLETVWRHRKNILKRHNCGNMSEVVALCIKSGIL